MFKIQKNIEYKICFLRTLRHCRCAWGKSRHSRCLIRASLKLEVAKLGGIAGVPGRDGTVQSKYRAIQVCDACYRRYSGGSSVSHSVRGCSGKKIAGSKSAGIIIACYAANGITASRYCARVVAGGLCTVICPHYAADVCSATHTARVGTGCHRAVINMPHYAADRIAACHCNRGMAVGYRSSKKANDTSCIV